MNWAEELIDRYEKNSDKAGIIEKRNDVPYVLLPPFHTTVTAQIEVTINENGTFMRATAVDNSEKFTKRNFSLSTNRTCRKSVKRHGNVPDSPSNA